jgi:hypothetical protein
MITLIGGQNHEGYTHALMKVWNGKLGLENMPNKSALCRMRKRISYVFFKDQFKKLIKKADSHRKTYLGLVIYAIDGQMLTLPRSKGIVAAGFTGRAIGKYSESYMPKGFLTHAYDVISGVSKDLRFSNRLHEQQDAEEMIPQLEKESLTIYDRLYFGERLVKAHYDRGNHFLFRCRKNACLEILEFFNDKNKPKTKTFLYKGKYEVHLIRIKNHKSKTDDIFATSLHPVLLKSHLIKKLYRLRWEVETSFMELTGITKAEQWHSKSVNGIYQELYARFWLINYTKLQIHVHTQKPDNPLRDDYEKPNFKLLYNFILLSFPKILKCNPRVLLDFERLRKKSLERRKHHARSYKRELKSPASPYKYNNTRWYFDS